MKKVEQVENEYCDFCQVAPARYQHCMGCGKAICYDCVKIHAKEYRHSVYCSGSGDGLYCLECDARLASAGNPLHTAYLVINYLRAEARGWSADFEERAKRAEANVKRLSQSEDAL